MKKASYIYTTNFLRISYKIVIIRYQDFLDFIDIIIHAWYNESNERKNMRANHIGVEMEKLIKVCSVFLMVCLLTACGGSDDSDQNKAESNAPTQNEDEKNKEETTKKDEEKEETPKREEIAMSDDLFDYTVELDGVVYKLPFSFKEMEANGWYCDDPAEDLKPNSFRPTSLNHKDTATKLLSVRFHNLSSEVKNFTDCEISGISFNDMNTRKSTFSLPKGITIGSTKEEVLAAYGEPTKTEVKYIVYRKGEDNTNKIYIGFDDEDKVETIDIDKNQ